MVFFLSLFMSILFSFFFYLIDLWYLAFFPIAFFIFVALHSFRWNFSFMKVDQVRYNYSLILIWILVMFWLSGLLFFVGIEEIYVYLSLLFLNVFLWIWSFVFSYKDGKAIFEYWMMLVVLILLGTVFFSEGISSFFSVFSLLSCFLTALYAFMVFIVGLIYPVDKRYSYQLFLLAGIVLVTIIIQIVPSLSFGIVLSLFLLTLYYASAYWIGHWKIPIKETSLISVRRILAGERIHKKQTFPQWKIVLQTWFNSSPQWFKRCLELPNLLLLLGAIAVYVYSLVGDAIIPSHLWYWCSLALFLWNTYLLKKIQYVSSVSRFALALVVNFSLYSVLLASWSDNISNVLPFLVLWTFICQIALFYIDRLKSRFLFSRKDYLYWTIVTCFASIVNVVLLSQINLPGQFLFSLIFFYCGIELMILYYVFQFLNTEKKEKDSSLIDLDE